MAFIKTILKYCIAALILFAIIPNRSYAGGFPVRPGSLSISLSSSYFFADKGWDSLRHKSPFAQNGKFSSFTYSVYAELGLTKRFALTVSMPYSVNHFQQTGLNSIYKGLTDLETGIKWYVANINYTYYFSVQGTFITPLYTNLNLGYAEKGGELKLSFAGTGNVIGSHYFFNIDEAVRQYFGDQGPIQDRYGASFGLTLDKKLKQSISLAIGGFYSTSSFTQVFANQALNKNFAFTQASLSYGYSFSHRVSLFVTAGTFLFGRNTGAGSSGSIALNIKPFKGI